MNQTCYLCGSVRNEIVFVENGISIVRCLSCRHAFSTFEQKDHYEGYWDDGEKSFDLDWWDIAHRNIYTYFIKNFMKPDNGTLMDVGCGLGFFIKMLNQRKPDWKTMGYEMSEKAVFYAKNQNGLNNIYSGRVEDSGLKPNSIDVITLWDVIEHIPKPQPLLNYLYTVLKPGGFLFVQTPNFPIQLVKAKLKVRLKGMKEGIHYLEARDHINDYSTESLNKLALDCNYELPKYFILPPILSVAGSRNLLGKLFKISFYFLTKFFWVLSFKKLMLNNTLFSILKKPIH
ncbi:MAG: class I SAM-dependent methyltransferase [Leptospiraceae bacterium]|nr:class I SAM-dependent methyltransferase [Leptospiraceae bacterium]MCP5497499.1 class I SAM-dependent methyltransferase [Leptospiraceae bacterium]